MHNLNPSPTDLAIDCLKYVGNSGAEEYGFMLAISRIFGKEFAAEVRHIASEYEYLIWNWENVGLRNDWMVNKYYMKKK